MLSVLLALLLFLLLRGCECARQSAVPPRPTVVELPTVPPPVVRPPAPKPPTAKAKPKRRTRATIASKERPKYESPPPAPAPWLTAFRLQVAARGPLLARCFQGAERPGALKWTSHVDARRGEVSDHTLEPTLQGATLTADRRACLTDALSEPRYRLPDPPSATPTTRVSIVIEF